LRRGNPNGRRADHRWKSVRYPEHQKPKQEIGDRPSR
jgi:hypothetical protein